METQTPIEKLIEQAKLAVTFLREDSWHRTADDLEDAIEEVEELPLPQTLVGCSRCQRGYPVRYLAGGMCAMCLYKELKAGRL